MSSPSRLVIPCVKGKCLSPSVSTTLDDTYPSQLDGLITRDEFSASIARINESLRRPLWTYRVQTVGRVLIVLGLIVLLFSGVRYLHFKLKHHDCHHKHHNDNSTSIAPALAEYDTSHHFVVSDQFVAPPSQSEPASASEPATALEQPDAYPVEQDDEHEEREEHGRRRGREHEHGHKKCCKHLWKAGLFSFIAGLVLCRVIAQKKQRLLITSVVPAICAEHHNYSSSSRAVPVSWSLDSSSLCGYGCKNNKLRIALDVHSVVPLDRKTQQSQPLMETTNSAYIPLSSTEL